MANVNVKDDAGFVERCNAVALIPQTSNPDAGATSGNGSLWVDSATSKLNFKDPTGANHVLPLTEADDALVAHLAGAESFTGAKTFKEGTLKVNNSADTFATTLDSAATAARSASLQDAAGVVPVATDAGTVAKVLHGNAAAGSAGAFGAVVYADLDASIHGAFQTLAGAGVINITQRLTKLTSAATGAAQTLANGATGQRKTLVLTGLTTPGVHTAVVTPANGGPWTLDTVGDSIEVEFDGTNWVLVHDLRAVTRPPIPRMIGATGRNGAGAATATGAKVGDKVSQIINLTDGSNVAIAGFEAAVTVADQVQQTAATDLSAKKLIYVLRPLS